MTLGKKLSNHRKLLGMTQQQLGEYLNLSAQAVSKWENDLAEPDLSTLRVLANLYKVSLDDLLDVQSAAPSAPSNVIDAAQVAESVSSVLDEKLKENAPPLGFCKSCGIAVTEENLGEREPTVKCKRCIENERLAAIREQERKKKEKELEIKKRKLELECRKEALRDKRNKSLIIAAISAAVWIIMLIITLSSDYTSDKLLGGLFLIYPIFSFVAMLFYDTPVTNVISNMCSASIRWPGLIFTWDLDGFLWVIGMKILFAVLGFLFGLFCSILGIIIGVFIAPFVFPYIMIRLHKDIKAGIIGDYIKQ